jgi:hypothetical protein
MKLTMWLTMQLKFRLNLTLRGILAASLLTALAPPALLTAQATAAPAPGVAPAAGAAPAAAPLRSDHPVIGTWQVALPGGFCSEEYHIRGDGTTLVVSAQEIAESTFNIADQPDDKGYYKQVDTVVKDNGKQDCSGEVTQVGHSVTSYLLFRPDGNVFLMCFERDTSTCIGPFVRVRGSTI